MSDPHTFITDLIEMAQPPEDGILSRTIHADDRVKAVVFGFAPGQELSEHTAAVPAILQFVEGEAEVHLGGEVLTARAGSWIHMPPGLPHSILARTRVVVVLLMLRNAPATGT